MRVECEAQSAPANLSKFEPSDFWLDQHRRLRDQAPFDFAIDSKLRGCDFVKVRIGDIVASGRIRDRAV